MFSKVRGKTKFQLLWTESFPWAQPVEGNPYAAKCKFCMSIIAVDSMGRQALKSHAEGKKHISRLGSSSSSFPIFAFVKKPSTTTSEKEANVDDPDDPPIPTTTVPPVPTTSSQSFSIHDPKPGTSSVSSDQRITEQPPQKKLKTSNIMETFLNKEKVTKAEVLWSLLSVTTHMSLRAAGSAVSLFKKMFPDDEVAQKMQLQKTKISYMIVHGLGPYFENQFRKQLKDCKHVVIGFDESLNKIAQKQQMDVTVRFWDEDQERVVSRYLTSEFLEHATAEHLLQSLKTALREIEQRKIVQISMDGPNVNHKMIKLWKEESADGPQLLDIGSCGLHTMHCAFKYAIKSTKWDVVQFLRAAYNLFKDVPTRRGDFKGITGSSTFPLKFCSIRWLENAQVAERALQILPHIEEYVKAVKGTKKEPKCNSFTVIETSLKNKLLKAEIAFFQALAEKSAPFLREYQTDNPMVPFLHTSICSVLSSVMQQIVKKEIFQTTDILKIDVNNKENLKLTKNIILGFGTRSALKDCKEVSDREFLNFRNECKNCLTVFVSRAMERSPLKYGLTKSATCLDPQKALEGAESQLSSLLETLVKSNLMTGSNADKSLMQFMKLASKPSVQENFKTFKRSEHRLDDFWISIMKKESEHDVKEMREFVTIVLTLSHGNAGVERGFSINKECLVPNQSEPSLVAQRHVIEAVNLLGGVDNINVTKDMIHAARNARAKYEESLLEQKNKKEEDKKHQDEKKKSAALIKELQEERRNIIEETQRKVEAIEEKLEKLKKKVTLIKKETLNCHLYMSY